MVKSYFSKVAGFYRSSHQGCSVKKVFLERSSQDSQENTCIRDSYLIELQTWKAVKKRLWHKCFPVNLAKFLRTPFLQNTSGRLLLLLTFQKQPPEVFYEKRCSWKFRKIHRKTPLACEIFKNTFFTEHLRMTASAFSFSEAATGGVLWKKVFLKISQNSQENTFGLRNFQKHLFYRTPPEDCFCF